jgi:tetratricopeptide (TPR) repeat protein
LTLALLVAPLCGASERENGHYAYGGASSEALEVYRRGWVEILEYGRWAEAERLYRQALALDPAFTIAKSVLARITADVEERQALYREVESELDRVDADGLLILEVYQRTLELFAFRERGEPVPAGFRDAMARQAVSSYARFIAKYPAEWSVVIEFIEWVHALKGPEAALSEVARIGAGEQGFSYFPAYFEAELGRFDRARALAEEFAAGFGDPLVPQPHYLNAYISYELGQFEVANQHVARALELAPRHLIAQRLQKKIAEARASRDRGLQ